MYNPIVKSVLHPSDLSKDSEKAFAHALAISLLGQTRLTVLHAASQNNEQESWQKLPAVRTTLERWGLLEQGSPRSAVFEKLEVEVGKVLIGGRRPLEETLAYLESHPFELIVLATEGRDGLPQWLHPSFAENLARKSKTMTLFVPKSVNGFVSPQDGQVTIRRLLIPVDRNPSPSHALIYAARLASALHVKEFEVTLLHVGSESEMPPFKLPEDSDISWKILHEKGAVVDQILESAASGKADLIIMPTQGHQGVFDALRGSVTEQVVRNTPCPVLAIPA